jgi:hypothetical protein
MRILGCCDWKQQNQTHTLCISGKQIDITYNSTSSTGDYDYCMDIEAPFSSLSKAFDPLRRIYVTTEPAHFDCYTSRISPEAISEYYKGLVLSWHPNLKISPNFREYYFGTKWTGPIESAKDFGIGGIFSGKNKANMDGYALRRKILSCEDSIEIPSLIYNYRRQWRGTEHEYPLQNKLPAFRYMFHLAVENCQEDNYFTEKLIDCFACRVVPIYYGDPFISKKFNSDGIIIIDEKNFIEAINNLTPVDFQSRIQAMDDNFERSKEFWSFEANIANNIVVHMK